MRSQSCSYSVISVASRHKNTCDQEEEARASYMYGSLSRSPRKLATIDRPQLSALSNTSIAYPTYIMTTAATNRATARTKKRTGWTRYYSHDSTPYPQTKTTTPTIGFPPHDIDTFQAACMMAAAATNTTDNTKWRGREPDHFTNPPPSIPLYFTCSVMC